MAMQSERPWSYPTREHRLPASGEPDLATKVAFLSDPMAFPGHPASVTRIETHFAWVFLAGDRAYKLKKPSQLRGADWRSTAAREIACREEMRLNRRLSPSTYLSVEPLIQTPTGLKIGGEGRAADWLVVMRRLAEQRMLDTILAARTLVTADLDSVLQFLVQFYSTCVPEPLCPNTYLRRVRSRIAEAITALNRPDSGVPSTMADQLGTALSVAFEFLERELADRVRAGRIVEGHGDLRAEHICLGPPVQIIDALEVHDKLRRLDRAEEIAMLALECERPAAEWAPSYLRDQYRRIGSDPISDRLFGFYMALRAANRAKLAIWHLDDPAQFPDPTPWQAIALSAAAAALRHCQLATGGRQE
jgi:aminoglycoside phosphotransferase family enzyme